MPLYGCPDCGWATTASSSVAIQAHQIGVPYCGGELEMIEDWLLPGDEPEPSGGRRDARQAGMASSSTSA